MPCWPGGPAQIGPTFGRVARDAEAAGLHSLWVMDHFFQIPLFGPMDHDMLESYSCLAFAAGQTRRIELGAAWNEQESRGLGIPFPPTAERFERLEER